MKNPVKLSIALLIGLVGFPQISETIYTPALPNVAAGLQTSAHLVEHLAVYFLGFAVGVSLWGAVSDCVDAGWPCCRASLFMDVPLWRAPKWMELKPCSSGASYRLLVQQSVL